MKYGFSTIQRAHEERIKEQKAWARKVAQTLEKVLPLAEALSGIAGDFLTFMEGNKDEEDAERQTSKLQKHKQLSLEERMERGLVMCGTPEMAIEQITRLYEEFGHGVTNLSIKIGNVPDDKVQQSLELLRDEVFPAVRHLCETQGVAAAE